MSRGAVALLAIVTACGGGSHPPEEPHTATVVGIETVAARTQEVSDTIRAFCVVAGEREPAEVRDVRTLHAEADARAKLAAEQVRRLETLARGGIAPRKELEAAYAERAAANAAAERTGAALAAFGRTGPAAMLAQGEAWVTAEVLQDDVVKVQTDAAVTLEVLAVGGRAFRGRVEAAPTYVSRTTRTAPARLRVQDGESLLRPGMTGTASITTGAPRTAVVVPTEAILQDGAGFVTVREEAPDRFVAHRVQPGVSAAGWTEVRGLDAGARVATTGAASALSAARLPGADE